MNGDGNRKSDIATPLCIAGCFAVVALLFITREVCDFFFAGYVSQNLKHYMEFGRQAAAGLIPYRDFPVEYPPLGALWFWLLAPFSGSESSYNGAFITGMSVFMLFGLIGTLRLADMLFPDMKPAARRVAATAAYTVCIVAAGPVCMVSLDYIPMALSAWALAVLLRKKHAAAFALLAVATASKGYPAVMLPVFIFYSLRTGKTRGCLAGLAAFALVTAAVFAPPFLFARPELIDAFRYHSSRGIEIGSTYGAALLSLQFAGLETAVEFGHGSWNVIAGEASLWCSRLSLPVMLFLLLRAYSRLIDFAQCAAPDESEQACARRIVSISGLAVAAFMLGFKVGSPQFLCWLIPVIAPLATGWRGLPRVALFCAAGIAAQWVYPWHMQTVVNGHNPFAVAVLASKSLLLILIYADLRLVSTSKRPAMLRRHLQEPPAGKSV